MSLPLALVTDAGTAAPSVHYIHTDHLGTPQAMTSSGLASIEWSAAFRPFGEVHAITGSKSLDLRFHASVAVCSRFRRSQSMA